MPEQKNSQSIQRELCADVLSAAENAVISAILGFAVSASEKWPRGEKYRESKRRRGNIIELICIMYIDLLVKLKNAQLAKKENIKIPYSKMKEKILEILQDNNYIESFEKRGRGIKRVLDAKLKYENNRGVIRGIKFISKPSCHFYIGYKDIKPSKSGYGLLVISTPKGLLSGQEAKKMKLGGEMLFEIW